MIKSGALIYLLSGNLPNGMTKIAMDQVAANGINDLLTGVAWAMIASICGIFLTTLNSLLFKSHKLKEESGKNSFLAWMQSSLLPELPSDTSDALNKLVKNLNKFNNVFADNTTELKSTLNRVNEVYRTQDNILQTVRDMDVMKMAEANVQVLQELSTCTEQIEKFSDYLVNVNEYTKIVKSFTEKYESESERLHVLEDIRNFFNRHKGEIAKETADSDDALKKAITLLKETSKSSISEFNKELVEQSDRFKSTLKKEKEDFEELAKEMKAQFSNQLQQMPMIEKNLKEISTIPAALDKLIIRMEQSNATLASNVTQTMNATTRIIASHQPEIKTNISQTSQFPSWMKWIVIGSVVVMAIACVTNTTYYITHSRHNERTDDRIKEKQMFVVPQDAVQTVNHKDSLLVTP